MKSPHSMTTDALEPFAREWMRRVRTPPLRQRVQHVCPHCGQTIVGTREFRRHKPQCRKCARAPEAR